MISASPPLSATPLWASWPCSWFSARLAHQGSRLSAVRWAQDHAVSEVLGLDSFDEDDLYAALDDLCARQEKIEQALYQQYQRRCGTQPPRLFLYDVTSSYLEGERNELGEFGYNRDGKNGKLQIVIGLLADAAGRATGGASIRRQTVPILRRWPSRSGSSKSSFGSKNWSLSATGGWSRARGSKRWSRRNCATSPR